MRKEHNSNLGLSVWDKSDRKIKFIGLENNNASVQMVLLNRWKYCYSTSVQIRMGVELCFIHKLINNQCNYVTLIAKG